MLDADQLVGRQELAALARRLAVLSSPTRLELLEQLRQPRPLSALRVSPSRRDTSGGSSRPIAMPTVARHIERLVEEGYVIPAPSEAHRGRTAYAVNQQRMFMIAEAIAALARRQQGRVDEEAVTVATPPVPEARHAAGPRLVLVRGLGDGTAVPLGDANATDSGWIIGRDTGAAVRLDYDPFVSHRNSIITRSGDAFTIHDVEDSKNGTTVNWNRLRRDEVHTLRRGDIIGVGRTLMVFYDT